MIPLDIISPATQNRVFVVFSVFSRNHDTTFSRRNTILFLDLQGFIHIFLKIIHSHLGIYPQTFEKLFTPSQLSTGIYYKNSTYPQKTPQKILLFLDEILLFLDEILLFLDEILLFLDLKCPEPLCHKASRKGQRI